MEKTEICILCESKNISVLDSAYDLYFCHNCGLYFNNPRPSVDEIARFYSAERKSNEITNISTEARALSLRRRLEAVKRHKKSGRLLDVGAGGGDFLHIAAEYFEPFGNEISDCGARIAKEKYGLELKSGELEDIRWDVEFDVITLFHVLEHVPWPGRTIKKCHALLRPGGVLVLAVPNELFGLQPLVITLSRKLMLGKWKNFSKTCLPKIAFDGTITEIHLSHFTSKGLQKGLEMNGFRIMESTLDPAFSASGLKKIFHDLVFHGSKFINRVSGRNIYPAILIAAKRVDITIGRIINNTRGSKKRH